MPRYFLYIEFLGTPFGGWQKQPEFLTVQGEIERCVKIITKKDTLVYGSGRTDAGVHASHQVAHVDLENEIDLTKFKYSLNSLLPKTIQIWQIKRVNDDAHARFNATSRAYEYKILTQPSPLREATSWFMNADLDGELLNKATKLILPISNFEPFSKENLGNIGSVFCSIKQAEWTKERSNEWIFRIESDRFLHHMVRYLVGSMFKVGSKTLSLETFKLALEGNEPQFVHYKAPAQGLTLCHVSYPDSCFI